MQTSMPDLFGQRRMPQPERVPKMSEPSQNQVGRLRGRGHDAGVTIDARVDAATALIRLASSAHFQDRADAGYGLARFLDVDESRKALRMLILDGEDTLVTLVTAQALLDRKDSAGLEIVAIALASANDLQLHYIAQAADHVLGIYADELDRAAAACVALLSDDDPQVRAGATQLESILSEVRPVLYPEPSVDPHPQK